ncbi:Iojap protein [Cystobacter fuscus DSM 2262]|uniref:Ribosomal silencing factor RsfS n=1 Tax=Cystobacter fuscus (strain ATCC 25194 / DSM 2262 / NBRC 100088 / M29) TaxID=1242864 RepID=S9PKX5_CYSF2|nr:ribosome silencing factor [Cystobacter fuscus]EPX64920.1 Iojap protein [Cystobacter fuscus DSM 2262]
MATKKTTKKPAAKKKSATKTPAARKKTAAKKTTAKKLAVRKKPSVRKKKAPAPAAAAPAILENPRAHALARKIANLLSDKKAVDIVILDVRGMTSYADYVVVASGESDRQVSSMAEHVLVKLKESEGLRPVGHEGMDTGQWVLLDFGEVVAHIFYSEMRAHYDLEGIWADARREKVA